MSAQLQLQYKLAIQVQLLHSYIFHGCNATIRNKGTFDVRSPKIHSVAKLNIIVAGDFGS